MSRRHVSVNVGLVSRPPVNEPPPPVVIVGVVPTGSPWLSKLYPDLLIRSSRRDEGPIPGVEHLRVKQGTKIPELPDLRAKIPSRLQDSMQLAFSCGARAVDLILARSPGNNPWDLWTPPIVELLEPFVQYRQGAFIVMPDAFGPPDIGSSTTPGPQRLANTYGAILQYAEMFTDHFQIGLFDLPRASQKDYIDVFKRLGTKDVSFCAWEGTQAALERQGWRSAAVVAAVTLASRNSPADPLEGRAMPLPGGRNRIPSRAQDLGMPVPIYRLPPEIREHVTQVQLLGDGDMAEFKSHASMRGPLGTWTLPMLSTAKSIHRLILETANRFVFRGATVEEAFMLQTAIQEALQPYVDAELVSGQDGVSDPVVIAEPIADRQAPGLVAYVACFLRPWVRQMKVNLQIRPGDVPRLEVS